MVSHFRYKVLAFMTFDEWIFELEGFSMRIERLYESMDSSINMNKLVVDWLKAAYEAGREQGWADEHPDV